MFDKNIYKYTVEMDVFTLLSEADEAEAAISFPIKMQETRRKDGGCIYSTLFCVPCHGIPHNYIGQVGMK